MTDAIEIDPRSIDLNNPSVISNWHVNEKEMLESCPALPIIKAAIELKLLYGGIYSGSFAKGNYTYEIRVNDNTNKVYVDDAFIPLAMAMDLLFPNAEAPINLVEAMEKYAGIDSRDYIDEITFADGRMYRSLGNGKWILSK